MFTPLPGAPTEKKSVQTSSLNKSNIDDDHLFCKHSDSSEGGSRRGGEGGRKCEDGNGGWGEGGTGEAGGRCEVREDVSEDSSSGGGESEADDGNGSGGMDGERESGEVLIKHVSSKLSVPVHNPRLCPPLARIVTYKYDL